MNLATFSPRILSSSPLLNIKKSDVFAIVKEIGLLTRIPSPTFHEEERAEYIWKRLERMELNHLSRVGNRNILARMGRGKGPVLLLAAHMDTVFPPGLDIDIQKRGDLLVGPGVGDNSLGLIAGLHLLERFQRLGIELLGDLIFAATTCEEGFGNLRGMTEVMDFLKGRVDYVLAQEGLFQGRRSRQASGSERWKVHFQGPGGHSWEDSGNPNPNHALIRLGNSLLSFKLPRQTTLNLSLLEGGESINSISTSALVSMDIRSLHQREVDRLSALVRGEARKIEKQEKVKASLTLLGKRPAGGIPQTHALLQLGRRIHRHLGIKSEYTPMSSDANIPLSRGIPSLTIGIAKGGHPHRKDEFLEMSSIASGMKQLIFFVFFILGCKAGRKPR
jgi:acetylornithine deacetylase/succinyl-diaminopimelate desuccinylase-like protein